MIRPKDKYKGRYDKLVRDYIIQIAIAAGHKPVFHRAQKKEFGRRLKDKLLEEIRELFEARGGNKKIEELGDILEVLEAFMKFHKIKYSEVSDFKLKKFKKRGGFEKRIVLEKI